MLEFSVLSVEIYGKVRMLTHSARVEHMGVCYSISRRTLTAYLRYLLISEL